MPASCRRQAPTFASPTPICTGIPGEPYPAAQQMPRPRPRSLVEHLMLDEHPYSAGPPLLPSSKVRRLGVDYLAGIGVANDQRDVVVRLGGPANYTDHGLLCPQFLRYV